MDSVTLIRTLRNGQVTRENMPRYLAELALSLVARDEPNTARAIIKPYHAPEPNRHALYRKSTRFDVQSALVLGSHLNSVLAA